LPGWRRRDCAGCTAAQPASGADAGAVDQGTRPDMTSGRLDAAEQPPFDQLLATAAAVARDRPEVDPELAREVFLEAAQLLHNGLVLDDLDDHDAHAVVAGLCIDLIAPDPGAAVQARSRAALEDPGELHDPEGVSATYLVAGAVLQL
jgi:hypothetical protein